MPLNSTRGGASAKGFGFTAKGAAGPFTLTISSPQTNLNLATFATSNGWPGTTDATITIDTGVWIYSTSVPTPGLTTGAFPGGLTIINKGYIAGMGGNGAGAAFTPGPAGGNAISLGTNTTINNTNPAAFIGGGGGGGATARAAATGGGGAGGGNGGVGPGPVAGGTGGAINASGGNGNIINAGNPTTVGIGGGAGGGGGAFSNKAGNAGGTGGGGGRIFPGSGGAGGTGVQPQPAAPIPNSGGAGGAGSAAGGGGTPGTNGATGAGAGGGGWGANGGTCGPFNNPASFPGGPYPGGSGGKAVALNGYSVTWTSGDTARVFGAVS